jgi:hypothetical protein
MPYSEADAASSTYPSTRRLLGNGCGWDGPEWYVAKISYPFERQSPKNW